MRERERERHTHITFSSGGTNFGFFNGANWMDEASTDYQPTITSYGKSLHSVTDHVISSQKVTPTLDRL